MYCPFEFAKGFRFNFEHLDILGDSIGYLSDKLFIFYLLATFILISSVSIYYRSQSDIGVQSYCRLNLFGSSIFNFERSLYIKGLIWPSKIKSYFHLNLLGSSIFNFEHFDILRDSIGHTSKKL
ncbi:hypothetical protein AAZX31_U035100 [Glycine max]